MHCLFWENNCPAFKIIVMSHKGAILEGHTDLEKGAYLGAVASIASADRSASPEELEYLSGLCEAADLSERQKAAVLNAATEVSGEELTRFLDVLKKSDLKYPLVTELMAFAKASGTYSEEEQENIDKIAKYLDVNDQQVSLLDEFAEKAATAEVEPQEMAKPGFLSSLGLKDKMQSAGINTGGLLKGLLSIAGPMLLSGMFSRNRNTANQGMFGAGGNMFGGGGGLGSLIRMLSGGRSMNSTGGLFGRLFG
jgi:uncharacterized tellurite resistance protein B-like protein